MSDISDYVENYKESLVDIIRSRDIDKDMIQSALKIVKDFIIERDLIVFGGMAIDGALRLKGSSIYVDNQLPDYDCLSDNSVNNAYDLGEILFNSGFEDIKVIRAIHVETMRVRVNLISVMDIGYIPTEYFKKYKTLRYDGLRILHPDIQRIDMHSAFSFPLQNAPKEDIFHRWSRDIVRFNLFEHYYPIKENKMDYTFITKTFTLPINITDKKYAFHGFMAYALLCKQLSKYIDDIPVLNISFQSANKCTLDMPCESNLMIVTSTDSELKRTNASILNIIPQSHVDNDISIYFTNMLSICSIDHIQIATVQYLLMYFLFMYNFDDKHNILYGNFYLYTLRMISIAEDLDIKNMSAFMPSITYLGNEPPYIPINVQDPTLPINYYPHKLRRPTFDYSNFKRSGEIL